MPLCQRRLWHGEEYLEEALSEEEADARQVLTCQMIPTSDCVIDVLLRRSAKLRWPAPVRR